MKKILKLMVIILSLFSFINICSAEEINKSNHEVNVYLFYGEGCPHCAKEIAFLNKELKKDKYSNVILHKYETWYDTDNQKLMKKVAKLIDTDATGVPFIIIGKNTHTGWLSDETSGKEILDLIEFYQNKEYKDVVGDYLGFTHTQDIEEVKKEDTSKNYKVPLLGNVNSKNVSLGLLSVVMGLVDGFNPCAMWILLFLLSLLISTKDRKKMWILGLTFILTSGLIYALFMVSWLNVAKYTSKIIFVRNLIGLFAIVFGIINLYRYIKSIRTKNVGCDVTKDTDRKKIMNKIRKIISENKLLLSLIGIMLLAISVNLIELLCSLGLPVMFTEILGLNNLSKVSYGIYIFIYILFFLIDDLIIFFIAMKTLKVKGISNKYMKYSHLIGGLIMLIIGVLMIVKPSWIMFNF